MAPDVAAARAMEREQRDMRQRMQYFRGPGTSIGRIASPGPNQLVVNEDQVRTGNETADAALDEYEASLARKGAR